MNAYITSISDSSLFTINITAREGDTFVFADCIGLRGQNGDFSVYKLVDDVLIPRAIFYKPTSVLMTPNDVAKMQEVARNLGPKVGH